MLEKINNPITPNKLVKFSIQQSLNGHRIFLLHNLAAIDKPVPAPPVGR